VRVRDRIIGLPAALLVAASVLAGAVRVFTLTEACFSTVPPVTTSASAMPAFERPSAISVSTSRSRAVSAARPSLRRLAHR
jgi:hypothetical protein